MKIEYFKHITKYLAIFFAVFFVIDFVQIHVQLFNRDIQFNLQGFDNYFKLWQNNADALSLSFAVISLYFIFNQIDLSVRQNYYPIFENWKNRHSTAINELKQYSVIYHIIDDQLFELYYNLSKSNSTFRITSEKHLKKAFRVIINKRNVKEFEKFMLQYKKAQGEEIDSSNIESHAFLIIKNFLVVTFPPGPDYQSFEENLKELYLRFM